MSRLEFATLYDFSYLLFDNYRKAKQWREKIIQRSYMSYWREWLGDYSYSPGDIFYKFRTHNIIISYKPSLLPDWSNSIVGLMFYRKYIYNSLYNPSPLYIITFMDRRLDFFSENIDYKYEFSPKMESRFLEYLNIIANKPTNSVYLIENKINMSNFLQKKTTFVPEHEAKYILKNIGIHECFSNNLLRSI